MSPITEFRPPPCHIYRSFSCSCSSHPSASHLSPPPSFEIPQLSTKVSRNLFPPRTPRSAGIRVAVACLAALMLNVYSSGPTHASQKILVSTAGNAFITNPAISNPEAVSSCTRNLGVKSEPHGLYAAHRTRHGSHLSTLGTSSGAWCFWLECWIEDCRLQRIPGTSLSMLQNSTIKPTRNRVQALGGNANTRTVPNPQCPGPQAQPPSSESPTLKFQIE